MGTRFTASGRFLYSDKKSAYPHMAGMPQAITYSDTSPLFRTYRPSLAAASCFHRESALSARSHGNKAASAFCSHTPQGAAVHGQGVSF